MPDILPIVFAVVLVILTVVLSVVGIQIILVLMEIKRTLKKFNNTLDMAETKINQVIAPLQSLGGMATGVKSGIKVFEAFVSWLQRDKETK
ncbi:MAG: hypothetical protein GF390_01555 [Candidatus Pacebacteria bacterium]|nr:hypothetical protein [Candidatus Paceibacterota bacterium]